MTRISSDWERPDFSTDYQEFYKNLGLLILRIGVASMILFGHGFDKLVNFSVIAADFPDPLGFGSVTSLALTIFAEVFCSLAIAFGFAIRLSVLPLIITMLTAAFAVHGDDPWSRKELAILYIVPYLTLLFTGAGRYSVDYLWFGRRKLR